MEISVIIPVYNAEKFLTKAVESVLQFDEVKELLLIEDGSPDNGIEICRSLEKKYKKVKLLQHPDKGNHGAGASRNLGLAYSSQPYITFLDADDFYLPNRFVADKRIFSEFPDVDGVYNAIGVHYYSKDAESIYKTLSGREITTVTEYLDSKNLFESHIGLRKSCGHFHIIGLTIKKAALEKMDYWFNPQLKLHQDTEFLIRLTYTANLLPGEIKIPTATRGVHDKNRIISINLKNKEKKLYQKKLWDSLSDWAEKQKIFIKYRKQIYKIKVLRNLAIYNYADKWIFIIKEMIKNKSLFFDFGFYKLVYYAFFRPNE